METLFVLDASGFLYRSYFAIRNMTNSKGESTNALFGFIRSALKLLKDFHPQHIVAVFDGPNNAVSRTELYSQYKAHRSQMPPDLRYQIEWARQFCEIVGIPFLNVPNVEADDTMGSIAVWAAKQPTKVYLCTSDKDLCQLVSDQVFILNTHKDNLIMGPKEVEEAFGVAPKQMIDLLAIIGDASDNVPGLSGFGPKTAEAVLKQYGSLESLLDHASEFSGKKKQTLIDEAEQVRISKRLVTINCSVDVPKDVSFYHWRSPDLAQLRHFYGTMNFNSLLRELEKGDLFPEEKKNEAATAVVEETSYIVVDDEKSLGELVTLLSKQKEVCIDTETTDIKPLKAELVGVGFCIEEKKAWYVPVNGNLGLQKVLGALKALCENPAIGFYGHNIKYDLHVLENHGISIANICFDTILASYVLNAHQRQHSLDALSLEYFGKVKISIQELIGKGKNVISMRDVPIDQVGRYCCEDVDYTLRLKSLLEAKLKERNLTNILMNIELPLLRILAKMERKGIYIDIPYLKQMSVEITQLIKAVEEDVFSMAGESFNLNSPKQMSEILFTKLGIRAPKKTATGLSTNADVLESLKDSYPIAGKILEYRTLEKLRSTYIDTLPDEVLPSTQRIHCNFNQSVAATGRLSSQDPNLQNIPIRTELGKKIRAAFRPQKQGWSFLSADYSQIELRLLAHLSGDPMLIDAFIHKEDVHRRTAASILGIPLDQVTSQQRYQAKAVNFGVIYGQQAFGLSKELGIDFKDAAKFIELYFNRYKRVKEYIEERKIEARQTGKAVTMTGRERAIPEITSKNGMLRSVAERLAVNTPLQGTSADLIKLAMLEVDRKLAQEGLRGYMILQIHDELLFEFPDEEAEALQRLVKKAMEGVWKLKVPLEVNLTIGKNWAEC